MAASALVESDLQAGQAIFEILREDTILKPTAILWLYFEDAREWRLVVATPDVTSRGPRAAYLRVQNVLRKTGLLDKVPLRRFVVTAPDEPVVKAIGQFISVEDGAGATFQNCAFGDMEISGAHVYRLQPRGAGKATVSVGAPKAQQA